MLNYSLGASLFRPYEAGDRVALYYPCKSQEGVIHGVSKGTVTKRGVDPVVKVDDGGEFLFLHIQTWPVEALNLKFIPNKEYIEIVNGDNICIGEIFFDTDVSDWVCYPYTEFDDRKLSQVTEYIERLRGPK